MTGNDITLMTLGGLLLLGLATDAFARYTPLPRVTLLVLFGVAVGPTGLDLLPVEIDHWYALSADIALLMIGFLLGSKLSLKNLRKTGSQVLWISSLEVIGVAAIMFAGLVALGFDATISLLLAGIAPASAPAAIANVVDEVPHRGRFTELLLEVVAVDDAWGLIAFSIFLACAQAMAGGDMLSALSYGGWELGGALLVGAAIGLPAALLTGRVAPGQPTLMEALGVVLFCGGLALYLEVSFLLSAMIAGTIIANFAHHHERPFHEISNIQWPFMVLFFVLAGASLHFETLLGVGLIGAAYIFLRVVGLTSGAWLGARISGCEPAHCRWIGLAITPQAGVALGMALVAASRFPELRDQIMPVIIGTTVIFELAGPILTRLAILRADQAQPPRARKPESG